MDANDPKTSFGYTLDRDLETVARPDGQTVTLGFEPTTGRLSTVATPRGVTTQAYHATTGNVETLMAPGGENLVFGYDGPLLLSTTWSGTVAGSVSQTYDNDFRVASQSVNGGFTQAFLYDDDGLLTNAGAMTLTPDPLHGLLTATSLGIITTSIGYNGFGEISSDAASIAGVGTIYSNAYTIRDKLGRIRQKVETIQGTTTTFDYDYDAAGRLWRVHENAALVREYGYDANGNRTSLTEGAQVTSGVPDAQDRLLSYGSLTFTYNLAGDLETKTDSALPPGQQTTTYGYDALGNLISVALPDGTGIEYVIDGQNRRIGKKVNGNPVKGWLYQDQLNPVAELDGSGGVVSRFVYGSRPNVPDYMVVGSTTYRILSDHLGSVRLVVNAATGNVAQRIDYDEFGRPAVVLGPADFQPFGFAGGIYDPDTGLTRFGLRDYDSVVGRWTARDPLRFDDGSNHFAYAGSDPISFFDPDGLSKKSGNQRHTQFKDRTVQELEAERRDPSTTKAQKKKIETELKSRKKRNVQKRTGKKSKPHAKGVAAGCVTTAHCKCLDDPTSCADLLGFDPFAGQRADDCEDETE